MDPYKYIELIESIKDGELLSDERGLAIMSNIIYYFWKRIFLPKEFFHNSEENRTKKELGIYLNKHKIKVKGIIDEYIKT